jgi:hypothetical protein
MLTEEASEGTPWNGAVDTILKERELGRMFVSCSHLSVVTSRRAFMAQMQP